MPARVPTFTGAVASFRTTGFVTANAPLISIYNKTGSGVLVAVRRFEILQVTTGNNAVAKSMKTTRITTAPSTGTVLTPQGWDTAQTHNANVEIRGLYSADDVVDVLTITAGSQRSDGTLVLHSSSQAGEHIYPPLDLLPDYPYPDDPLVLRENEGIVVHQIEAGVITNNFLFNAMIEEFTYAVDAAFVPYRNPMPPLIAQ